MRKRVIWCLIAILSLIAHLRVERNIDKYRLYAAETLFLTTLAIRQLTKYQ